MTNSSKMYPTQSRSQHDVLLMWIRSARILLGPLKRTNILLSQFNAKKQVNLKIK